MIWAAQDTEAGRFIRSLPRSVWEALFREERITIRETMKAHMDAMIFGSGFVIFTGDDAVCERVDPALVWIKPFGDT